MAARLQASFPLLSSPSSGALLRSFSCDIRQFGSSSKPVLLLLCAVMCLLLLPPCKADKNEDLLDGLNRYRLSLNYSVLAVNPGAQCLAVKFANLVKDSPCTNSSAQYAVNDANIPGASRALESCRIAVQNYEDARTLPVCVNDTLVDSALPFYTKYQKEYQAYLNSTDYVSAGVGSAGTYFFVILGTAIPSGNLAQTLSSGSSSNSPGVPLLLSAVFVAKLLLSKVF